MKRKHIIALAALALCGSVQAQDIYQIENLSGSDLNGTARYVGMGGAMNALGADISTMGSNPAAIGMYRRSDMAFSGSITAQPNGESFADISRSRASFDQAGFVYSIKTGNGGKGVNFINFGFNYQKRRNLKNYVGLNNVAVADGLSQSWQLAQLAYYNGSALNLSAASDDCNYTTPLTLTAFDAQLIGAMDANGKLLTNSNVKPTDKVANYSASNASAYNYRRAQWGGVQQYDFNISFNCSDRIYGGFTLGLYNVNIHSVLAYDELLYEGNKTGFYNMDYSEDLSGVGVDGKFGLIVRPIEDNPFRVGVALSTPVFYDLSRDASVRLETPYAYTDKNGTVYDRTSAPYSLTDLEYRIRTPWKLNISAATTVGNYLALDAEYEMNNYSSAQLRWPKDDGYDYFNDVPTVRDKAMDAEIDNYLKTTHTFRIGAEVRLAKGTYARVGYNYVSSPFQKYAKLNCFTSSASYHYNLNTDYVNLGAINRVTVGLGYHGKNWYADLAYQFQAQKGDVYAYNYTNEAGYNLLRGQSVELNRQNVMLTIGYKF